MPSLESLAKEINEMHDKIKLDMSKVGNKAAAMRARVNMGKAHLLYKAYRKISFK